MSRLAAVMAITVSTLLASSPCAAARSPAPADSTAYDRWVRGLLAAAPDPARGAHVEGLVLERDAATLRFASGTLHLLREVEGRTWGALFVGEGTFSFTPPLPVERAQLRRHFDADSLSRAFTTAVLFFTDGTVDDLGGAGAFSELPLPGSPRRGIEAALEYLVDDDGRVARDLMTPLLNGVHGFFHAFVAEDLGDPLMFEIDPLDFEEISLLRRAEAKGTLRETVTRFHRREDLEAGSSRPQSALDLVRAHRYDVAVTLDDGLDVSARASVRRATSLPEHPWVPFSLHPKLEVDSVVAGDGTPIPFSRGREAPDVWVDLSACPDDSAEVVFHYHGDIMDRPRRLWVEMETYTTWYPFHAFDRPAAYRLTFVTPERYQVATVGRLVSETRAGKTVTRVWETPMARQVGFNVGEFESRQVAAVIGPPLTVQISEVAHSQLASLADRAGALLLEQKDMAGAVGSDLSRAFAFFGQAFGPTPATDFVATEIPQGHGQAFPGLVLLSWATYQTTDEKGFDEMFRAHEVAHQWWGIGVRPATYHDAWLAEGFSEFSGIWYMARTRGSVELYMKRLEESRDRLLKRRGEAPPVWLGTRAGSSRHPEDYELVVYRKGAWILHMLRSMLLDHQGSSEDAFEGLMQGFYQAHVGGSATTEQFSAFAEERLGRPLDWFFDQWVYGSDIPTYTFSHTFEPQPDGKQRMRVRVRQERVPDTFRMPVPIELDFGELGGVVVRVEVAGPLTEAEFTDLPAKPVRVVFNPYQAVLAETKTEGWKR